MFVSCITLCKNSMAHLVKESTHVKSTNDYNLLATLRAVKQNRLFLLFMSVHFSNYHNVLIDSMQSNNLRRRNADNHVGYLVIRYSSR